MTTFKKIKWILGISLIFLLVLATNLIDKRNFNKLKNSVTTIYEDRIVASDLIFSLSMLVHEKEIALVTLDSAFLEERNNEINGEIEVLVEKYKQTKLTHEERSVLDNLKTNLIALEELKAKYAYSKSSSNVALLKLIGKIDQNLYRLSKIQLEEGRREMNASNRAMSTLNLLGRLEIAFLIFIAVVIQVVILYQGKKEKE